MATTEGNKKILTVLGEEIEEAVSLKHSHDNEETLNKITEVDGIPYYNGEPINTNELTEEEKNNINNIPTLEEKIDNLQISGENIIKETIGEENINGYSGLGTKTYTSLQGSSSLWAKLTEDGKTTYDADSIVGRFFEVRDEEGNAIYGDKLYINQWRKGEVIWAGYTDEDENTCVASYTTTNSSNNSGEQIEIDLTLYPTVRYLRFTICDGGADYYSGDFVITTSKKKKVDWFIVNEDNFLYALPSYLCNSNVARVKGCDLINVSVSPSSKNSNYVDISVKTSEKYATVLCSENKVMSFSPSDLKDINTTVKSDYYALVLNKEHMLEIIQCSQLSKIRRRLLFIMLLWVSPYGTIVNYLGNDRGINCTSTYKIKDTRQTGTTTYIELTETPTDKKVDDYFIHSINPINTNWDLINEIGSIDKFTTPYPFIMNSTIQTDGMFVAQNGDCTINNTLDNGLGGNLFQGWNKSKEYRSNIVNDDRLNDNLPMTSIHSCIKQGIADDTDNAYGWVHIGSDNSLNIIDETIDTSDGKVGIYIHPKVSIVGTPLVMEAKPLLTSMPQGYEVDENGNYTIDGTTNKRIKLAQETIDGKNVLQVNESNELCFHSATDNKWYKINMTEITE